MRSECLYCRVFFLYWGCYMVLLKKEKCCVMLPVSASLGGAVRSFCQFRGIDEDKFVSEALKRQLASFSIPLKKGEDDD